MSADPTLLTGLGAATALFLAGSGAAYGTSHASIFALRHPTNHSVMTMSPVIISGVLAVYGVIVGTLLALKLSSASPVITTVEGYKNLCAGLSVGLACLASGVGMGNYYKMVNDNEYYFVGGGGGKSAAGSGGEGSASKKCNFVTFALCMVYLEAIGLYGLIVSLFLIW
jgi:V-type H+-transporting ATPase proteolipid subunit